MPCLSQVQWNGIRLIDSNGLQAPMKTVAPTDAWQHSRLINDTTAVRADLKVNRIGVKRMQWNRLLASIGSYAVEKFSESACHVDDSLIVGGDFKLMDQTKTNEVEVVLRENRRCLGSIGRNPIEHRRRQRGGGTRFPVRTRCIPHFRLHQRHSGAGFLRLLTGDLRLRYNANVMPIGPLTGTTIKPRPYVAQSSFSTFL